MRTAEEMKEFIRMAVTVGPNDCWVWQRRRQKDGYGATCFNGKQVLAHRISYILHKGELPSGLQLDHLCRHRACVNPAHLEPVTSRENTLRGNTGPARNAAKTHCGMGHPLSGENLYIQPGGKRRCKECNTAAVARYKRGRR